jgi:hypothetical protein
VLGWRQRRRRLARPPPAREEADPGQLDGLCAAEFRSARRRTTDSLCVCIATFNGGKCLPNYHKKKNCALQGWFHSVGFGEKNEKLLVVILKKHVERRNKAAHHALPKKGKSDVHP